MMPKEPKNHPWGRETTREELQYRIAWERWVAEEQRKLGMHATASAHDLARADYERKLHETP